MNEPVDPRDLPADCSPAYVETRNNLVFVADVAIQPNGWARITQWDGGVLDLPPHQCGQVRYVATERVEDELRRRISDPERREHALPDDEDDGSETIPLAVPDRGGRR